MNIHQISVFLENRAGQLAQITALLAEQNVDIRAISIAETADYGLARMIVDDSYKASNILLQNGVILSMTPVWAVEVHDGPGGLSQLLKILSEAQVGVEYMYSLFAHQEDKAYMVMRVTDEPKFLSALGEQKIKIMTKDDLGLK